jgi:N-acetylglucosaminyldiphosphoundecaprenol N-acetyl-beta-D-mannosaminyltransferase
MNPALDISGGNSNWEKVSLLDIKIDALALDQLLLEINSSIQGEKKVVLSYVNIHGINLAFSYPWFRTILNRSYVTFCDGVGIKFAARLTGQKIPHRFTPPDFMGQICESSAHQGWKVFFLGARPGVAQRAAERLIEKFPNLKIKTHDGYFDKTRDCLENQCVITAVNDFQPQVLVVGFGMPLQEKWIFENLDDLNVNIAFPVGALFDYLSGEVWRAPRWVTDNGLEWLARLLVEPRRLWKRYVIGIPLFFLRVIVHHFLRYPLPR